MSIWGPSAAHLTHWWLDQKFPNRSHPLADQRPIIQGEKIDWANPILCHNFEIGKQEGHGQEIVVTAMLGNRETHEKDRKEADKGKTQ